MVKESIILVEVENDELEYNEFEKDKGTVNTDTEAKQPTPVNISRDKSVEVENTDQIGTDDKEAAEAIVDVRIMDNLIDEETSDLIGMKDEEAPDGVEDIAVGSKRRKMGHQIDAVDHSLDRALPSGEGSPAPNSTSQGPGQRKAPDASGRSSSC